MTMLEVGVSVALGREEERREEIEGKWVIIVGTTNLLVSELDQTGLILHNLVLLRLTVFEQFRQSEPLSRHLIPVVRVHELIVVYAVGCVPLHFLDGRFAAVEIEDVVDESLALL